MNQGTAPVSAEAFVAYLCGGHLEGTSFFPIQARENAARHPVPPIMLEPTIQTDRAIGGTACRWHAATAR